MATAVPRRTPWVAVDVDGRKDERIVDLPGDTARYGYFLGVLAEARLATPRGVFGSRAALEEAIGRFAGHVDDYLAAGLLERSPQLCTDCRERFGAVKAGAIVVHNWHRKQQDPTHAERQRRYEAARRNGDGEADAGDDAQPDALPDGDLTADSVSTASESDGSTRARAVTRDTRHVTPDTDTDTREAPPARAPARTAPRSAAGGRRAGSSFFSIEPNDERHPVAKLLATRFKYREVTPAQWDRLFEIVDNEFPVGTKAGADRHAAWSWLAELMRKLPRDAGDPIEAAFAEVNRRIDERKAAADADEAAWAETKERYADEATAAAEELRANGIPVAPGSKANGHTPQERPRDEVLAMLRSYRGTVDAAAWAKLLGRYHVTEEELADAG